MHIAGVYNLIYIYGMNFLDILIALLLAWFIYLGFNKGLIASVATLIGLAAGLYFSIRFSHWVGQQLFSNSDLDEGTLALTSFIITFIAVLVATYLLGKFVTNLVRTMRLGWLNKLAGALFGSLKAILILSVLLGFLQKINHNYSSGSRQYISKNNNILLRFFGRIFSRNFSGRGGLIYS